MAKHYCDILRIPQLEYPADWDDLTGLPDELIGVRTNGQEYNKQAGHIRNSQMANDADALFAIWDEKSNGTHNMICQMLLKHKPVQVISVKGHTVRELYDFTA